MELTEIEAQVDDLGKLKGRSHLAMRGDQELLYRGLFRRHPKSNWKNLTTFFTVRHGAEVEISDIRPDDPGATEKPFVVEYDFTESDYLDWSSKKSSLALPRMFFHLPDIDPDKKESSDPIDLGSQSEYTYRLKISFPSRYKIRAPLPVTLIRDYADYRSSYTLEGSTLTVEQSLRVRQREIPAARRHDYFAFWKSMFADSLQSVSLESTLAGSPVIPDSMKVEDLLKAAEAAVSNDKYALAEELLNRVLSKEPTNKSARGKLGAVLYEQRKYDAAITVIRENIKINPFDTDAHSLLGQSFQKQQKYEESEAAFRKLLEITPLDRFGQGALGRLLR